MQALLLGVVIFGGVMLFLAFLPSMLTAVFDPIFIRRIRGRCAELGVEVLEIRAWPNHYGVRYMKNGQKIYARCKVTFREIKWLNASPEST